MPHCFESVGRLRGKLARIAGYRTGWPNYTFAFHDGDEVGAGLLPQIAKKTGLRPEDL